MDSIVTWLTNEIVSSVLLSIAFVALILQLYAKKFNIIGLISLLAFTLFFTAYSLAGSSETWAILLFLCGLILFAVELVLPGGILGVLGTLAIVWAVFSATGNAVQATISLSIAFVAAGICLFIMSKVLSRKMLLWERIILRDALSTEKGYVSTESRKELISQTGISLSPLRPAGTALINGERVDVVSEGNFIEANSEVEVVEVEGMRIIVRQILA